MKRMNKLITTLLVFVLMISLVGCGGHSSVISVPRLNIPMEGSVPPEISHNIDLSGVHPQTTAEIYKFIDAPSNPDKVLDKLAKIFGFSTDAKTEDFGDFIIIEDAGMMIDYETPTGAWSFRDKSYDKTVSHSLPSEKDSATIARSFLMENDLYHERFSMETVVAKYSGDEADKTYSPYCHSVYFYPTLNDKPILGVSRIVVSVGEDGKIVEVLNYYKDFVSCGEIELASPMSFIDGIKTNQYSTSINPEAISSDITDVELAYWEDGGSCDEQPYLQPVWVFKGTSVLPDGTTETFDVIVQAAKNVVNNDEILSQS